MSAYLLVNLELSASQKERREMMNTVNFRLSNFLAVGLLAPCAFAAGAQSDETDCPAAFRPYSTAGTPLQDLMLNPAAKEVVDRDLPGFLSGLPPILTGSKPPTLADVLTIRIMSAEFTAVPESTLAKLDKDLAAIPLTRESAIARCARYDHAPFALPEKLTHPAILVSSKSNGFRDNPSVDAGKGALQGMADREHWSLFFTDNAAVFNTADLRHFDAVVWNNVSGDVTTKSQRRDFKTYVEHGGGFAGFHGSGGDPFVDWDWYVDTLIGARFLSHPMSPQFQAAKVKVDDAHNPVVQNLQPEWTMTDEWYLLQIKPARQGCTYSPDLGREHL